MAGCNSDLVSNGQAFAVRNIILLKQKYFLLSIYIIYIPLLGSIYPHLP